MKHSNFPYNKVTPVDSIRSILDLAVEEAADKVAYRYRIAEENIKDVTYAEFVRTVNAIGTALDELGVADKHIAQIGENSYRWITVYLAAIAGKGVYVPIDKELDTDSITELLIDSESKVLVYSDTYADIAEELQEKLPK